MRSTTNIIYGVTGQTLELRALEGRPSSGTISVFFDYAGDDQTPLWTATASVDTVNTTLVATSGAGQADPTLITLSPTGIVTTRKYLLSETSRSEWISPVTIGTSSINARHLLKNTYTTAATFVSTTMTATVDASFVANLLYISDQKDPNPSYRVRWSYVVGGVTYIAYSFFDIARAIIGPQVDIDDLEARAPGLTDALPTDYATEQGRPLIAAAWQSVRAKLASLKIDTDALRNDEILDELVVLRALNMVAQGGWRPLGFESLGLYIDATTKAYERFIEQHFQAVETSRLAIGQTGGAETQVATPYWAK